MLSLIKISYRVLSLESRVANSSVLYVFGTVEVGVIYCAGYTGKYTDASWVRYCTKRTQEYCEGYTSCQAYLWGINLTVGPLYVSWSLTVQYDYSTVQINMQINDLLIVREGPIYNDTFGLSPNSLKNQRKISKILLFLQKNTRKSQKFPPSGRNQND